jgi:cystathionine gamma-synthase/methionine-gamma-lyase
MTAEAPVSTNRPLGLSTRCVHAGDVRDVNGALHAPRYSHSTFGFAGTQDLLDVIEGRVEGALYTRYGMNPTIRALEAKLADLEGAEAALAFGSGMAAEAATLLAHARAGDHIVCIGDVYGGTFELLADHLPRLGIMTTFVPARAADRVAALISADTRVVYFETPTNPMLDVIDIAAVTRAAHAAGALVVVDNTFASPVNQQPLAHGADLVVHSATKYLGGHSDLTAGAVMGPAALVAPIGAWRKNLGQIIAPDVADLLARSLRTLAVRVRAHNVGASAVAGFLADHPRVLRAMHPSRCDGVAAAIIGRQMSGGGGMVSFVFDGDATQTAAVIDRLRLFAIAPSLGGVESLVTQPVTTSHHDLAPDERERRGIVGGLVRLSIGIEDPDDLIADLDQALAAPAD